MVIVRVEGLIMGRYLWFHYRKFDQLSGVTKSLI